MAAVGENPKRAAGRVAVTVTLRYGTAYYGLEAEPVQFETALRAFGQMIQDVLARSQGLEAVQKPSRQRLIPFPDRFYLFKAKNYPLRHTRESGYPVFQRLPGFPPSRE